MKDEFAGQPILSFYGTGANAYRVNLEDKSEKNAKGVKKYVIQNSIDARDYKDVVENSAVKFRKMNIFRSILHDMYTQLKNKVALSPKDEKRYIIPDSFKTLAWGHKNIEIIEDKSKTDDEDLNNLIQILQNLVHNQYKT